jgi:TetR/AcrR family transcriptional regulator, regulator of autoinduction and epiphytic fitness
MRPAGAEVEGSELEAGKTKRVRRDPETARTLILDATERLMVHDGYAAVTTRRVAQDLGLNAATIHHYYPTTDDLFIALHKRMMDRQHSELEAVLDADNALEALWNFQSGWNQSALGVEFIALANHRKSVSDIFARVANQSRDLQADALARAIGRLNIDPEILSPMALATMSVAIARTLANEERVGITKGHADVRKFVSWLLSNVSKQNPDT